MGTPAERLGYTWRDYRSWDDGKRWELLGGEPVAMSPAPTVRHQQVLMDLCLALGPFFAGRPCRVLPSPTDVKLSDEDVVQPDLLVVCDPKQMKATHIEGPPALVVEILSPSTANYDRHEKRALYARSGVKELWLVTPYPSLVEVFALDGQSYRVISSYERNDTLVSPSFTGLEVDLSKVFDFSVDPDERIMQVREARVPYPPRVRERGGDVSGE